MEIYLTAEVPMGINIDQLRVQRNRYQMTPSNTVYYSIITTYRQVCLGWHSVRLGWHSMHTLWLPENGRNWLSIQPKMAHSFSASNMPMQADTMPTQADSTVGLLRVKNNRRMSSGRCLPGLILRMLF